MAENRHIEVSKNGMVTVVRFRDHRILDTLVIERLAHELFRVAGADDCENLLLNFAGVGFLSSSALGKLLVLNKRMKAKGGQLKLCEVCPEIAEIFELTKLNQVFDIKNDETNGLLAFYK
jgi:anti-sigma B factor antagonist